MDNYDALMGDIKARKFSSIYFFCGEEEYYIDRLTEALEATVIPEGERAFNQTILYGKDVTAQTIIETCRRLPMMSDRQLVVLREAQSFKDVDQIEAYIRKPVPSTILVFAYKHGKPDMRKAIYKDIKKYAAFGESKALRDYQLPPWITSYMKTKGCTIHERALALFVESVGVDLSAVTNEIDKLLLNKMAGSQITIEDVEKGVGVSKEYNVFELNNALGMRDTLKAFKIITYFASNPKNGPIVMVMGSLQKYFLQLYTYYHNRSKPEGDIAAMLKVSPYFVKDYKTAASKYNDQSLRQVFYILEEYDLRAKGLGSTGSLGDGELLKEMVSRILAA
jgi:DNA polymerase III subunit delta